MSGKHLPSLHKEDWPWTTRKGKNMTTLAVIAAWISGSVVSAELLGYWLHRLLHSGAIGLLSRGHMKHHLVHYGPFQGQQSETYRDATAGSPAVGNIGLEWLVPSGALTLLALGLFRLLHVDWMFQMTYFATTLAWSFLMFSYLHDVMHVKDSWLERNRWSRRWFLAARGLHDIHHRTVNGRGLMDKNFGIGWFLFDKLFGTLRLDQPALNQPGLRAAEQRFKCVLVTRKGGTQL